MADAGNWRAHQSLGNLYVRQGRLENAGLEFGETIHACPDCWTAYLSLAALQLEEDTPAKALATLHKLRELRPALLEAGYLTAYALADSRKFAQAEAELESVEAKDATGAYKQRISELRRRMESKKVRE